MLGVVWLVCQQDVQRCLASAVSPWDKNKYDINGRT